MFVENYIHPRTIRFREYVESLPEELLAPEFVVLLCLEEGITVLVMEKFWLNYG